MDRPPREKRQAVAAGDGVEVAMKTKKGIKKQKAMPSVTAEGSRLRLTNPYALIVSPANKCSPEAHKKTKENCGHPWCVWGMDKKQGIWATPPEPIRRLGADLTLTKRRIEQGRLIPVGLKNLGGTCYLNVLIQALFGNKLIVDAIFNTRISEAMAPVERVLLELQKAFAHMKHSDRSVYDLKPFVDLLNLSETEQQDPLEFNSLFLEKCFDDDAELPVVSEDAHHLSMAKLLCGKECYVTTCKSCKQESASPPVSFRELALSIENCSSLEEAMSKHMEDEILDCENQYFCSRCQEKKDAGRRCNIVEKPAVLIIALRRYVYNRATYDKKKLRNAIAFPDNLDFGSHGTEKENYTLVSVLYHRGVSAHGGHYVADVLDWDNQLWWHCDDGSVRQTENPSSGGASAAAGIVEKEMDVVDLVNDNDEDDDSRAQLDDEDEAEAGTGKKGKRKAPAAAKTSKAPKKGEGDVAPKAIKSKAGRKPKKATDSQIASDPRKDAYMLAFVKTSRMESAKSYERIDTPAEIKASVDALNAQFGLDLKKYEDGIRAAGAAIKARKDAFNEMSSQLLPSDTDQSYRIVPSIELRNWIIGHDLSGSIGEPSSASLGAENCMDLTSNGDPLPGQDQVESPAEASSSGLESSASALSTTQDGMCRLHKTCGIFVEDLSSFKVISNESYQKIFTAESGTHFYHDSFQCGECCAAFGSKNSEREKTVERYTTILCEIDANSSDVASASVGFCISNKWHSGLQKAIEKMSGDVVGLGAKAAKASQKSTKKSEKSIKKSDVSDVDQQLLDNVNCEFLCQHGAKVKNVPKTRYQFITEDVWKLIIEEFPGAMELKVDATPCEICGDQAAQSKSAVKEKRAALDAELGLPGLAKLYKRKEMYPSYFIDKSLGDSKEKQSSDDDTHFVLDGDWLQRWRNYHDGVAGRPECLHNQILLCKEHNMWYGSDELNSIVNYERVLQKESERGDGLPPAELVDQEQWNALLCLMERWKAENGEDEGDAAEHQSPVEIKLIARKWECWCAACSEEKKKSFLADILDFTNGRVHVTLLSPADSTLETKGVPDVVDSSDKRIRATRRDPRRKLDKITVTVSARDTVYDVKMNIYQQLLSTSPLVRAEPSRQVCKLKRM